MARYAQLIRILMLALVAMSMFAEVAAAQSPDVNQALSPFQSFLVGIVKWLLGPGRLVIALAWLVVGFKIVLGMERGGVGGFIFVALVGLAIVNAPRILALLGIDLGGLI